MGLAGKEKLEFAGFKESVQEEEGLEWYFWEMGERYEEAAEEFWEDEEEWAEEEAQE